MNIFFFLWLWWILKSNEILETPCANLSWPYKLEHRMWTCVSHKKYTRLKVKYFNFNIIFTTKKTNFVRLSRHGDQTTTLASLALLVTSRSYGIPLPGEQGPSTREQWGTRLPYQCCYPSFIFSPTLWAVHPLAITIHLPTIIVTYTIPTGLNFYPLFTPCCYRTFTVKIVLK